MDDLAAVADLLVATDMEEFGEADTDIDDLRDFWRQHDLAQDAWLVTRPDGEVVAYGEVSRHRPVQLEGFVAVHPDHRRRGIGTWLADRVEERAQQLVERAPPGTKVTLLAWSTDGRDPGNRMLAGRGYEESRRFWRMRIDMGDEPPAGPSWPEGIAVRAFDLQRDGRATFEAVEDAFADHWGHVPAEFEEWLRRTEGDTFDPALWFLATDGDAIVGTALCATYLEMGWIRSLGVRRPYRGRGLGEALLRHTFVEFHARGRRTVCLGVDSESLTGATRLYERAGMRVDRSHAAWTRTLRDGIDLAGGGH